MCYNIEVHLENTLKRARHYGDEEWIKRIEETLKPYKLIDYYQVSGFDHPEILIYTNKDPFFPTPAKWGLIPHWVKDLETANKISNQTINARGETIFEKASFKNAARNKRCLIYLNGFYEHHYLNGKAYPFYIYRENHKPIIVGGLWEEWVNKHSGEVFRSCSIITKTANQLMKKIHNNPKLSESRMPFILSKDNQEHWLNIDHKLRNDDLLNLIQTSSDVNLKAHSVQKLSGKESLGNTVQAKQPFQYPELINNPI